jgi:hypothetical protein
MYLVRPSPPTEAEIFRERLAASLRKDSAEWQSVQVFDETIRHYALVPFGSKYVFHASKRNCDGQDFVLVAVMALETGDWVCECEIGKDGSEIHFPGFFYADAAPSRQNDPELRCRAIALGTAYWALTWPLQK